MLDFKLNLIGVCSMNVAILEMLNVLYVHSQENTVTINHHS